MSDTDDSPTLWQPGQVVPDFELRDQHGQTVSLTSFRGHKSVVLMFFPFAFSAVCTGELREVRDHMSSFVSEDVKLLAVSCDPMFALRAFSERDSLTFPLLSDFWPHGEAARAFGVFNDHFGGANRSTFVIDREGVLRWSVHNALPDARSLREYAQALSRLDD